MTQINAIPTQASQQTEADIASVKYHRPPRDRG